MATLTRPTPIPGNGLPKQEPPPAVDQRPSRPVVGFHGAVCEFKRRLIEATLTQAGGNRTRAARALGLQRTYLLRLMREFEIRIPAASTPQRQPGPAPSTVSQPAKR